MAEKKTLKVRPPIEHPDDREHRRQISASVHGLLNREVLIVRKTADETVNNSTTLQDDDDLAVYLDVNETVYFQATIFFNTNTTADIKFAFTIPSGATIEWNAINSIRRNESEAVIASLNVTASGTVLAWGGASNSLTATIVGSVNNGSTVGNLQLQWAQNTADVSDTKVLTNSSLIIWGA